MRLRAPLRAIAPVVAGASLLAAWVGAQESPQPQLGPAPRITGHPPSSPRSAGALLAQLAAVDISNRQASVSYYNSVYLPALAVPNDWNGSVAGCNAGTTSTAYTTATMDMVNFFRAMTGLPATVAHEATKDAKSQAAALMMTANNSLNHFPPPTWTCYSADGAEAAGKANLALGAAGASAVQLYIRDPGASNTAVGHRRWILYPRQVEMGTGSTSNANALWVIGVFGTRPLTPELVNWPPAGYVPYQLVYPRWSFSVNTGSAVSFTGTTVTMTRFGAPVSLTILANATGYGDNTLVWEPQGLAFKAGATDDPILVQVDGVTVGGVSKSYAYTVTVIDPALVPSPTFTDDPLVSGVTTVKAVHIQELRVAVNALRARYALPGFTWTDAVLTPGVTPPRAAHVLELRTALNAAYLAAARTPPVYTRTLVAAASTIAAIDITELRAAVLALWN